jgi:hypothetical protein
MEGAWRWQVVWVLGVWLVLATSGAQGLRFVIDKTECWQHEVPLDGDEVHVSYVVIKSDYTWSFGSDTVAGLDLTVRNSPPSCPHNPHFAQLLGLPIRTVNPSAPGE